MKKKTIACLVVVSLLALPVMASAAAEFTFGGYLKLHVFWDSSQTGKNLNGPISRKNDPTNQHGRLQFTSTSSRFNFTVKGPDVWGAKTTGYIEMDFDGEGADSRQSASHAYEPRLRHAFFRMNWPETELLLGQYWSMFCEFYPDLIQDGPFQMTGAPTHRLAQARLTYKTGLNWAKDDSLRLALLVGKATDASDAPTNQPGQETETPQVQGLISYEADLWGKGPFYNRPRGTVFQLAAGWQRTRYRAQGDQRFAVTLPNGGAYLPSIPLNVADQEYLNNWMAMATLFVPIVPTHTKNLAGTAALTAQWWIGEGVEAFGFTGGFTKFNTFFTAADAFAERELVKRWGGYVMGTYYFTNEWYTNVAWGYSRTMSIDTGIFFGDDVFRATQAPAAFANVDDPFKYHNEISFAVYYRPVTAIRFGLGYSWAQTKYYQDVAQGSTNANKGENHRVQFAGWFYF